jgi:hypothetical protein
MLAPGCEQHELLVEASAGCSDAVCRIENATEQCISRSAFKLQTISFIHAHTL